MLDALNSIVVYICNKHAIIILKRTYKRPVPWITNIFGLMAQHGSPYRKAYKFGDKESMASL